MGYKRMADFRNRQWCFGRMHDVSVSLTKFVHNQVFEEKLSIKYGKVLLLNFWELDCNKPKHQANTFENNWEFD